MTGSPSALSVNGKSSGVTLTPQTERSLSVTASTPFGRAVTSGSPAIRFRDRVNARVGTAELLVFRIGNERFGVDLQAVEETVESPRLHEVPESSETVLGVFAHGEQLLPMFDTAAMLGMIPPASAYPAALVMRGRIRRIGLAVEDVEDVVKIELSAMRVVPEGAFADDLLLGLIVLDRLMIAVLDARALVSLCQTTAVPEAL